MNISDQISQIYSNVLDVDNNYVGKDDVTIVVPTLNEEKAIEIVLNDILLEGYSKIFLIDGNSVDETVNIAEKMQVPAYTQSGRGKTGAIKSALNYIKTPYFVIIDGDATYSAKDIEKLLEKAPHYNQVIGARQDRVNIKMLNRFGNDLINMLFNLSFGTKLTDVCSGLYVLNTSRAKQLKLETGGFDVEVEIAAQTAASRKITEVPISYSSRIGVGKLNPIRDGFLIMTSIIKLSKRHNPLVFYSYLLGLILTTTVIGFVIRDIVLTLLIN